MPLADGVDPEIVALIEELVAGGHAYAVDGLLPRRAVPEYGRLSRQRPDQVEEQEPNPLKEDSRLRPLEGEQEDEDTW